MNLQDTLYNWLSIKKVKEERPDDQAAHDTFVFFDEILKEDHKVINIVAKRNDSSYVVEYTIDEELFTKKFPADYIEALWDSIEAEPKYN